MNTWYLIADSSSARLFAASEHDRKLQLVRHWMHAQGRSRESELRSDKPGRFRSPATPGAVSALDPHTAATETEHRKFARELSEQLLAGRNGHHFDALIIAAPPHFLGLLREQLDTSVHETVRQWITKDWSSHSAAEIQADVDACA